MPEDSEFVSDDDAVHLFTVDNHILAELTIPISNTDVDVVVDEGNTNP